MLTAIPASGAQPPPTFQAMGRFTFPGHKDLEFQWHLVNKKVRCVAKVDVVQLKHVYRKLLWVRSKDKARKALALERFVSRRANPRLFELTKEIFFADMVTKF